MKGEDYYLSEAYISRNRKRPSLTAIKIIYDADVQVSGYLGADFDLRELPQSTEQYENENNWLQVKGDLAIRYYDLRSGELSDIAEINTEKSS